MILGLVACTGGLREQDWQAQLTALEQSLLASQAEWKIVIGHHPPRTNGHHNNTVELKQRLEPIMQVWRQIGSVLLFGSLFAPPCLALPQLLCLGNSVSLDAKSCDTVIDKESAWATALARGAEVLKALSMLLRGLCL